MQYIFLPMTYKRVYVVCFCLYEKTHEIQKLVDMKDQEAIRTPIDMECTDFLESMTFFEHTQQ